MPKLPHIYPQGAMFFISFRLADSLPQHVVSTLKEEYNSEVLQIKKKTTDSKMQDLKLYKLKRLVFGKYEEQLDINPYGACYLQNSKVARIIYEKIMSFDGSYYKVYAVSIMPNHVHILIDSSIQFLEDIMEDDRATEYVDVPAFMKLIKGGTAFRVNKYLNRSGSFWSKESYDYYLRVGKDGEFERIKDYILQNPIKAGLGNKFLKEPFMFSR